MPNIRNTKTLEAYKKILKLKIEVDRLQIDKGFDDVKNEVESFSIIDWALRQFKVGQLIRNFLTSVINSVEDDSKSTGDNLNDKNEWLKEILLHGVSIATRKYAPHQP